MNWKAEDKVKNSKTGLFFNVESVFEHEGTNWARITYWSDAYQFLEAYLAPQVVLEGMGFNLVD